MTQHYKDSSRTELYLRKALLKICTSDTDDVAELKARALCYLRKPLDFRHHAWCVETVLPSGVTADECDQCEEMWVRYPYDPITQGGPVLLEPEPHGRAGGLIGGPARMDKWSVKPGQPIAEVKL